jgi:hypothetical protein
VTSRKDYEFGHVAGADGGDLSAHAARLLAVEVLLADPEALQDDALEGGLYILRDRLREAGAWEIMRVSRLVVAYSKSPACQNMTRQPCQANYLRGF